MRALLLCASIIVAAIILPEMTGSIMVPMPLALAEKATSAADGTIFGALRDVVYGWEARLGSGFAVHAPRPKSCLSDAPRPSDVARSDIGAPSWSPSRFVPGFDDGVWVAMVGSNLIALTGATIPNADDIAIPQPTVFIYRHYRGDPRQPPSYVKTVPAIVYRTPKGIIYRMFVGGPIACLDLIAAPGARKARSRVYFHTQAAIWMASPTFSRR